MKKFIPILGILISLSALARFEEQYKANEIVSKKYENGAISKTFSTKDNRQVYVVETLLTNEQAEKYFQSLLDRIEDKKYQILNYTDVIATKKITFIAGSQIVVISKTMNEVNQLLLDITQLDKTDKFEEYLKLNDVHGSIGLTILNAKMNYNMRDKK